MEASELGGHEATPEEIAAKEAAEREAEAAAAESGNASGVAGSDAPADPDGSDESGDDGPTDEDERNPAPDQAPAATEAQEAIVGDQGTRDEQQPTPSVGSQDIPVRTSAPPPEAQSGVPLPEDRAAGVEAGDEGQE